MDQFLHALPRIAAATLTPLVMFLLGRLWPPRNVSEFKRRRLEAQYGWVDNIALCLSIASAVAPLYLFRFMPGTDPMGLWIIGFMFGLMVVVPVTWIVLATLPFGAHRFFDFWLFYESRWHIGTAAIFFIFIPLGLVGVVSAIRLWIAFANGEFLHEANSGQLD